MLSDIPRGSTLAIIIALALTGCDTRPAPQSGTTTSQSSATANEAAPTEGTPPSSTSEQELADRANDEAARQLAALNSLYGTALGSSVFAKTEIAAWKRMRAEIRERLGVDAADVLSRMNRLAGGDTPGFFHPAIGVRELLSGCVCDLNADGNAELLVPYAMHLSGTYLSGVAVWSPDWTQEKLITADRTVYGDTITLECRSDREVVVRVGAFGETVVGALELVRTRPQPILRMVLDDDLPDEIRKSVTESGFASSR